MTEQAKKYRVLSLGVGVQSSTMLMMCAHGEIAPPDFIIFSDPGWEPKKVHEYLAYLQEQLKNFPDMPEIIVTSKGNIREDLLRAAKEGTRVATIPFFIKSISTKVLSTYTEGNPDEVKETWNAGQVLRQCTMEYKIEPVRKKIRELTGFTGKRIVDGKGNTKFIVEMMLGISTDEERRMKESSEKWIINKYPLIDHDMSRYECLEWMASKGYMLPPKVRLLKEYGIKPYQLTFYLLIGYDTSLEEDLARFKMLHDLGCNVYAMQFRDLNGKPFVDGMGKPQAPHVKHFKRWVNGYAFRVCRFDEYEPYIAEISKGAQMTLF